VIRPLQSHDSLLADIHASNHRDGGFRLWWLGQSGFLLQWHGIHVLLDPYLSDSLTKKYRETETPHVRMTELVIDPARLSMADIVTSTHNHTDHLDTETLCPILAANPHVKLVIGEANRAFVADRLKIDAGVAIGLDDGTSIEISGIRFCGVASAHEALERDGRFTTAVTQSGTKGCPRNCGLSE
jgi:L-ascorbate metabolism protein UlaG (beta-lactamase superfamily)